MRRTFLRVLSLCLALSLAFGLLTGCAPAPAGDAADAPVDTSADAPADDSAPTQQELRQSVLQPVTGGVTDWLQTAAAQGLTADGRLWMLGDGAQEAGDVWRLVYADLAADDAECLSLTLPPTRWPAEAPDGSAQQADSYPVGFLEDGGRRYILLAQSLTGQTADAPARVAYLEQVITLCALADDGALQPLFDLQLPPQLTQSLADADGGQLLWPQDAVFADGDGSFWLQLIALFPDADPAAASADGGFLGQKAAVWLLQFDLTDGSCQSSLPLAQEEWLFSPLRPTPDVAVYLLSEQIAVVDGLAAGAPRLSVKSLPAALHKTGCRAVYAAEEPLFWNINGIYRLSQDLTDAQQQVYWADWGLDGLYVRAVYALPQEGFLIVTGRQGRLALQRLRPENAQSDAAVLTVAVCPNAAGSDTLRAAVQAYNFAGGEYYIRLVEYGDDAARERGYADGREMLARDILDGRAPDILQFSPAVFGNALERQGFFLDLYPFLDGDAQLRREDFLPVLLEASGQNGTLPLVTVDFSVLLLARSGAAGPADARWTPAQYRAACDALPALRYPLYGLTRTDLLLQGVFTGDAFLDLPGGQCRLDSPAFCELLTAAAALPADWPGDDTDPKPLFAAGQALAYAQHFGGFAPLKTVRYVLDGDFVLSGLPLADGAGCALSPGLQLGISRYCQNPQAAWDFVRTLLLPDFQAALTDGFAASETALAQQAAAAGKTGDDSCLPLYLQQHPLTSAQQAYWQGAVETADAAQLLACIRQASGLYRFDAAVASILLEEAAPFFAGDRTAEDAAKIMQDRVQTYLAEQE